MAYRLVYTLFICACTLWQAYFSPACQKPCEQIGNGTNVTCICSINLASNHSDLVDDHTADNSTNSTLTSEDEQNFDPFIAFSRVHSIESVYIDDKHNRQEAFPPISFSESMKNVIGLSFDYDSHRIFYSDIQLGTINKVFFNGSDHQVILRGQGSVEGISFDRHSKDLWWTCSTDSSINKINLVNGNFPHKVIKLATDDKLRGIAVHGCRAYVFWVNWNSKRPSIQRAHTSGWKIESIIDDNITMPNAITIDHEMQRIYWVDARQDKIERCDLDGKERHVVLKGTPQHPFAIAVYQDYIFWTDWMVHGVFRINKNAPNKMVKYREGDRPMGIIVVAPDSENCMKDPCSIVNGGCSDKCHLQTNGTVMCSCYEGRSLAEDGKRCMNLNFTSIICNLTQFQCGDGRCIPYELTCDGYPMCADKSDENEKFCAERVCPEDFFTCVNARCIHNSKVCDGYYDCPDRADEKNCTCNETMFKCTDGPCIPIQHRCDREPDCPDISDEIDCPDMSCVSFLNFPGVTSDAFVPCTREVNGEIKNSTLCIPTDWICDSHHDCFDGSDEKNCPVNVTVATKNTTEVCDDAHFRCDSGQCISADWRCDSVPDCDLENTTDPSDERNCNYSCAANQFKCLSHDESVFCVPLIWTCDGHKDCKDGSDEDIATCSNKQCAPDSFKCATGQCIPKEWVCDGDSDCPNGDNSDENPPEGCKALRNNTCEPDSFTCRNSHCVLKKYFCDKDDDCGDGSDEPATCLPHKCPLDKFSCKSDSSNFLCIPSLWKCNGLPDCPDGSDEEPELCATNETKSGCSQRNMFECHNKNCVDPKDLCDGRDNCGDFSDEEDCNVNECLLGSDCQQKCEDLPIGYKCSCEEGYIPIDGGKVCKDINECETSRPCSQYCANTFGSYHCSCAEGYSSIDNGISCRHKTSQAPEILFSERHSIISTTVDGKYSWARVANLTNAVGIDYDDSDNCIYWSEVSFANSSINKACFSDYRIPPYRLDTRDIVKPSVKRLHTHSSKSPDGIAIDWVAKNIYWCEKIRETIEVSDVNGKFRKILIKTGLEEPRAIALDPFEGHMYWTDWGGVPYIGRAGMDGSNFTILINTSLVWPNALTIDYVTRDIYWADAKEDYISVAKMDGSHRAVIVSGATSNFVGHIFAISIFEDFIYWTEWNERAVFKCHKRYCSPKNTTKVISTSEKPMDIHIWHPLRQPKLPFENPCKLLNCSALCLLKPGSNGTEATCACPEDFVLADDKVTCVSNCSEDSILCPNTLKCIPSEWFCDNYDDCGDEYDEPKQCNKTRCHPGYFQCLNGSCILSKYYCDGVPHCADNSDEFCNTSPICPDCDICGNNVCLNGGKCSEKDKTCICKDGFSGPRCEFKFCDCLNGGICNRFSNKKQCQCQTGYSGQLCEIVTEPACQNFYCQNGGYCQASSGKAYCKCPAGWEGTTCNKLVKGSNVCIHYCQNSGNCTFNEGHFPPICSCPPQWSGARCETPVECKGYCLNHGKCYTSRQKLPLCSCPSSYIGDRCEILASNTKHQTQNASPSDWKIPLIVISCCIVGVSLVFLILLALRLRSSNSAFMHRRIDDSGVNLEITNPMFGEDEDPYTNDTHTQAIPINLDNKATNFANPMYQYEEEKTNLLNTVTPKDNSNGQIISTITSNSDNQS